MLGAIEELASARGASRPVEMELYSATEILAITAIQDAMATLQEGTSVAGDVSLSALLASSLVIRSVSEIGRQAGISKPTILELGIKSGYVGALAIYHGWSFFGVDRLVEKLRFQSALCRNIADIDIMPLDRRDDALLAPGTGKMGQGAVDEICQAMPFVKADVALCNLDLADIPLSMLRGLLQFASNSLRASKAGLLIFSSAREMPDKQRQDLRRVLEECGFRRCRPGLGAYHPLEIANPINVFAVASASPPLRHPGDAVSIRAVAVPLWSFPRQSDGPGTATPPARY
jgi:hypothetical protein